MIIFISTYTHRYTHAIVEKTLPMFRRISYASLLLRRSLPRATYIFSDFDRLGFWQLESAAHVYRVLRAAGCRVLNDPAMALQRLALLRRLNRDGINSFQAWAAHDAQDVDRFPVFIRTTSAHRGNLTEPLREPRDLAESLAALVTRGYPLADLIVVEYRAEPIHDGIFRKLAMYRVGDRFVPVPSVHERHWTAKYGEDGVAGEAAYVEDLERIRESPYTDTLRHAFDVGGIEYGRADFGVVKARPEIYEINTNPMVDATSPHRFVARAQARQVTWDAHLSAIRALDTPHTSQRVRLPRPAPLLEQSRRYRLLGYPWLP